jgi:microcystin-dependent protein
MTVSTTASKITYPGNASNKIWTFTFPAVLAADLQIYYTDAAGIQTLLSPTTYSVSLNAAIGANPTAAGGSVTYPLTGSAIALGTSITILRSLPDIQGTSFANQGTIYQATFEQVLDYLTMLNQQLYELLGRNITVAVSDPNPAALPPATQRANQYFAFSSTGDPIAALPPSGGTPISTAMQPIVNAATIAAAQALLGITLFPAGGEIDWPGLVAPAGWYFEYGQNITRAGNPNLLLALAPIYTCTVTSGSNNITSISSTQNWYIGMPLESSGFPGGTIVANILSSSSVAASTPATGNATAIQVFPFGNGNGSTTFTLPDARGFVYAGIDNMGGTPAGRITAFGSIINGQILGSFGGTESYTQIINNMPAHTHGATSTDAGHTHSAPPGLNFVLVTSTGIGLGGGVNGTSQANTGNGVAAITTTIAPIGGGLAHTILQPTSMRNKIIKGG